MIDGVSLSLEEVPVRPLAVARFATLLGEIPYERLVAQADAARRALMGVTIWNVNSTAKGGGVAEMLPTLLGYVSDLGIATRWLVMSGDDAFFAITKRIHNGIHGSPGDSGLLGKDERAHYETICRANGRELAALIKPKDIVILHDPQTAGLIPGLKDGKVQVVWRCHIGHDTPNEFVQRSWEFLRPYLERADAWCFSRSTYAPSWLPRDRTFTIPPSIDPFAAKNVELSAHDAAMITAHVGIIQLPGAACGSLTVGPSNDETHVISRHGDIIHSGPLPLPEDPLIVQISRWDRLKDMEGVMRGFADFVPDELGAHLALVGPNVHAVRDDPEGATVFEHCLTTWRQLPHFKRCRVLLVALPMHDVEENALMVNGIQRHARIVTQKSLHEGFGLTVAEAMWKGKAVVASGVGGIQDQISHNDTGLLVQDPTNLAEFGAALTGLLQNSSERERLGSAARQAVIHHYLPPRHLLQYAAMVRCLREEI